MLNKTDEKLLIDARDALKDIINASDNGMPYTPTELVELFGGLALKLDQRFDPSLV